MLSGCRWGEPHGGEGDGERKHESKGCRSGDHGLERTLKHVIPHFAGFLARDNLRISHIMRDKWLRQGTGECADGLHDKCHYCF